MVSSKNERIYSMVITNKIGKQNFCLQNVHRNGFEHPPGVSTFQNIQLSKTPCIQKSNGHYIKKHHFKYGEASGGSASNQLLYGSSLSHGNEDMKEKNRGHKFNETSAEIRKKSKEVKEAEEDRGRYLLEKQRLSEERLKQKRNDLDLLLSYEEPWGKPGGGAPKSNNMRTKAVQGLSDMDQESKYPLVTNLDMLAKKSREERNVIKRDADLTKNIYDPFGKPGAGAPNKDGNGKVTAVRTLNLLRVVQDSDQMKENKRKGKSFAKKQYMSRNGEEILMDRDQQMRYHHELEELARQIKEKQKESLLQDRNDAFKHAGAWDKVWGRPGNGAPNETCRRKRVDFFTDQEEK